LGAVRQVIDFQCIKPGFGEGAGPLRPAFSRSEFYKNLTSSKSVIFEHLPVTFQKLYLHGFGLLLGRKKIFSVTEVAKPCKSGL
jgi:hypothetical protein